VNQTTVMDRFEPDLSRSFAILRGRTANITRTPSEILTYWIMLSDATVAVLTDQIILGLLLYSSIGHGGVIC
jgi:hypothetical protein